MRTSVRLDDELLRQAKCHAALRGVSLTALFEEALREKLARAVERGVGPVARLPTFRGRGVQPGVDLHRSADLAERMSGARS